MNCDFRWLSAVCLNLRPALVSATLEPANGAPTRKCDGDGDRTEDRPRQGPTIEGEAKAGQFGGPLRPYDGGGGRKGGEAEAYASEGE